MTRTFWRPACSFLALTLTAWTTCAAQDPQPEPKKGVVERLGEKLDSAGKSIKRGARSAGESIQQQYAAAKLGVHNMSESSRVYGRLHWDKNLEGAKIEVAVKDDGVATLTGTVPDARARAKAVELTRDTIGVTQVVDQLVIGPAATTTTTTTKVQTPRGRTTETKVETTVTPDNR